ncbi:hypothetical protein ACTJJ4_11645 [Microbacterium sp. 22195]|uniref:hypothetical protein n=1 Tax=Microbacterium sp. 22195 TaxID=3453891 RepID=UPI003F84D72A
MSIADRIGATEIANTPVPKQYRQRAEFDTATGKGEGATGPVRTVISDERQLLELAGFNPDVFRIVGRISQWTKTHHGKEDTYSFFFQTERIGEDEDAIDLPALYAAARRKPRAKTRTTPAQRVTVVALSDVQAGKVDHRGGTPELIDRLEGMRERLANHLQARKPQATVLAEVGDLFEGFESGGNPLFTNDLSLAQQMDLAGTELYRFIDVLQAHGRVDVVAVTSNHTAWRNGKQNLGRPGDDLGLFIHKQVEKLARAAGIDAHWTIPDMYNESVVFDALGTGLGVVHGNQFSPGQAIGWWQKQQHGGMPTATADILLSGHYHHLTVIPSGRNPATGRQKWWLQACTTDNGSSWFRNVGGGDSDAGLLVFDITEDGFDLQSLTVL